ncbi:MAG: glycosyltransferase family 1 protein [Verrucomicrobia bacterium]|nr:glycosyltransferase family 1 protein [Verrucomicrobiota bacterium]
MRVLFLNPEQYVSWEDEPSNYELRLPILNCGVVTDHRDYCYQATLRKDGKDRMNREILALVDGFQPEIVINSTTWPEQSVGSGLLQEILRRGVVVHTQVWDSFVNPEPHEMEWFYSCTHLGIASSISSYLRYKAMAQAGCGPRGVVFTAGHHVFTEFFRKLDVPKVYDVTILGSNEGLRTIHKKFLQSRLPGLGISFHKLGGLIDWEKCQGPQDRQKLTDKWIPWHEYVKVINQSKVCVCSQTGQGRDQIKGKIFEFLSCGALVLTDASPQTQKLVPPWAVAYYTDVPDCLEKAVHYVLNDAERERTSRLGHEWFHSQYDYRKFWSAFLRTAVRSEGPLPVAHFEESHREGPVAAVKPTETVEPRALRGSSPINEILSKGYSLFRSADYLGAAREFAAACKIDPPHVEAFVALAHLARVCKDPQTHQFAIDGIKRIGPSHPAALTELQSASAGAR